MENKSLKIIIVLICCCFNTSFSIAKDDVKMISDTIHVSSTGNDHLANGSLEAPFYSLNKALQQANQSKKSNTDTLYILVAAGDYYMQEPVMVKQELGRPVVIKASSDEKPRLMGGIRITGWQKAENGMYKASIPDVKKYRLAFEQFYVNGTRATLARTPNVDWFFVKGSQETAIVKGSRLPEYAVQRINLHQQDWSTIANASNNALKNLKFRFYHKWDITRKTPSYIEKDSAAIYLQGRGMKPWNPIQKDSRYFMYDYFAALDTPGEWYHDTDEGTIYYMPKNGENMEHAFCIIPTLQQWIEVKGTRERPIKNITFDGLSFQYSSYTIPKQGEDPVQAAASSDAAMRFDFAEDVVLKNCEMLHTGAYAIWFAQECHNNNINHCYIADLGAGGIKIGEPYLRASMEEVTSGNVIDNNIIISAGHEQPCGVGIALFHTANNKVTHNEIADILYSGISVGWVWGYNSTTDQLQPILKDNGEFETIPMKVKSPAIGNTIMYNHIHHIGWGELSDMGAVYTLGESPGTRISYNVIHDVYTYDYGGWGLYTDEGSTGVEMSYNLVYRCKSGAFHQHFGKDNRIINNILALSYTNLLQCTRAENHLSFTFKHNLVLTDEEKLFKSSWDKANIKADSNVYWSLSGNLDFYGKDFQDWKKNKEPNSLMEDPGFRNPEQGDFRLRNKSVAKKIGFKEVDFSNAGAYGSSEWRKKAQLPSDRLEQFSKIVETALNKEKDKK